MSKEPIGLYIFRFVMGIGLFTFMCLLYWSSELLEKDMKSLHKDVEELKELVSASRIETQKVRTDVLNSLLREQRDRQDFLKDVLSLKMKAPNTPLLRDSKVNIQSSKRDRSSDDAISSHTDPSLPNLLEEDLFYSETLPKLLGPDFIPHGTMRMGSIGRPENLHPFNGFRDVSNMTNMCTISVAGMKYGKFETMSPDMAFKLEERVINEEGLSEYWIHLRQDVYWQPLKQEHFPEDLVLAPHFLKKHKVTAHDFKFYLDTIQNPHVQLPAAVSLRNYLGDIVEFKIIDDFTFTVRWKAQEILTEDEKSSKKVKYSAKGLTGELKPLARFVYQYFPDGSKIVNEDEEADTYRNNSVWAQNFAEHWAKNIIPSCGAWIFDGLSEERALFTRNPDFYEPYAALPQQIELSFKETTEAVWQDFKTGKIDFYNIRPNQLAELNDFLKSEEYREQEERGLGIHRIDYVTRSYNYVGWNQATPWFQSAKVRRAMTIAIDRSRIIRQNLNGMGVEMTGPFFRYSPSYDKNIAPWPYDQDEARELLEEEGWYDSDGNGILDKEINGTVVPFEFTLTYYVKNPTTKINCDYIATALKEIGVKCKLNGVDIADLSNAFDEKGFDAIYLGWALGTPPEEPKQLWHSSGAKEKGSSNAVGFNSKEADTIIESLQYEYDMSNRIQLYHRFHNIVHSEAPYTFLYTPKTTLLYRDYVQNVFIPAERQDLIPGANVPEPSSSLFWLKKPNHG